MFLFFKKVLYFYVLHLAPLSILNYHLYDLWDRWRLIFLTYQLGTICWMAVFPPLSCLWTCGKSVHFSAPSPRSSPFGIPMISASHLLPWLHVPKILFVCLFGILSVTHARQFLLFYLLVHRFFPLFLPFSVESITELLFWLQSKIFSPFYLLVTEWDNVFGLFAEAIFHLLLACLWLFAEVFSSRLI